MSDRPRTSCPTCGEMIEPDETNVVEAHEMRSVGGQGDAAFDEAKGLVRVFHAGCWDERDPRYSRREP